MLRIVNRLKEKMQYWKEERLIKTLNKKVTKMTKQIKKLQIKSFNVSYAISRDMKRYRFTYEAPVIFESTKEEVLRLVFGNNKYKQNQLNFYFYKNIELVFVLTSRVDVR